MKKKYTVTCVYALDGALDGADFGMHPNIDKQIFEAVGESDSCGSGFGERDHAWYNITSWKKAQAMFRKLKKIEGMKSVHAEEDVYSELDEIWEKVRAKKLNP